MRTIFCYLAFRGCPNWWGYFYTIDISKSIRFLEMIAEHRFNKAEEFIHAGKYVHDYVSRDAIPLNRTNRYSGYDSPEYIRCVSHAHSLYLQEYFRDNGMLTFVEDLEAKQTWMKNVHLIPEKFNNLVSAWNKNYFGGIFGSGKEENLIKLPSNPHAALSEEIKKQLMSLSEDGEKCAADITLNASIWDKAFALGETNKTFNEVVQQYLTLIKELPSKIESTSLETLSWYLGLALAYYKHLKRVQFKNLVLA